MDKIASFDGSTKSKRAGIHAVNAMRHVISIEDLYLLKGRLNLYIFFDEYVHVRMALDISRNHLLVEAQALQVDPNKLELFC